MKHMVVWLCQVVATALVVFFCIGIILNGIGQNTIFQMAGQVADEYQEQKLESQNNVRIQSLMEMPAPEVRVKQSVFETGESIRLCNILEIKQFGQDVWESAETAEEVNLELLSIAEKNGNILAQNAEGISYEPGTKELSFGKGGSYVLKVRVTGDYGRYTVVNVTILVEAGQEEG